MNTDKKQLPIIGISGKKQSGKNTVGEIIQKLTPVPNCEEKSFFRLRAFADALKQEVAKATGHTIAAINDNKEIFRPILQWWGTEFRKKFQKNPKYWIDTLAWSVINNRVNGYSVIITDVRFSEEAEYVKDCGGVLLRVKRTPSDEEFEHFGKFGRKAVDKHSSETALDDYPFNYIIDNNGTLEELEEEVKKFVKEIGVLL